MELTEQEKLDLQQFVQNDRLFVLLKKIFLSFAKVDKNVDLSVSDELLGQYLRGSIAAENLIKESFKELERMKKVDSKDKPIESNPAR